MRTETNDGRYLIEGVSLNEFVVESRDGLEVFDLSREQLCEMYMEAILQQLGKVQFTKNRSKNGNYVMKVIAHDKQKSHRLHHTHLT